MCCCSLTRKSRYFRFVADLLDYVGTDGSILKKLAELAFGPMRKLPRFEDCKGVNIKIWTPLLSSNSGALAGRKASFSSYLAVAFSVC